jgi:hypothetical protein
MHHVGNSHVAAAELRVVQTGFAKNQAKGFQVKSLSDGSGGWQAAMDSPG